MTLNEREAFEAIKEIQDSIRREQLIFNTKLGCYTKKSGKMCVSANWTNGAWFIFERNAKAQAVPEGFRLISNEKAEKCIEFLAAASSHPNNSADDENKIFALMEELDQSSESGDEG